MPMTVMNNNAASMALGELNKNINKLGKELAKISSGRRINSAQDDASGYAIAQKMRANIRALAQDIQNSQTGTSLVKTASGGIDNIVDELRNLKRLALDAANDHNTDADRVTIQKEIDSRKANIEDIASTTNYNGIPLLDGRWRRGEWSSSGTTEGAVSPVDDTPVSPTNPFVSEPTGNVTTIYAGNYTISTDGVYMLDKNYKGTITVNAQNVELRGSPGIVNKSAYINCPNENTHLWIDNLKIDNTDVRAVVDKSIIKFTGSGNTLNVVSKVSVGGITGANILSGQGRNTAIVNTGKELTIYNGNSDGTQGSLSVLDAYPHDAWSYLQRPPFNTYGALLGGDGGENSNGKLTVSGGNVGVSGFNYLDYLYDSYGGNYVGGWGAGVGSGANGTFGSITVNGEGYLLSSGPGLKGACIGTGFKGTLNGDITAEGNSATIHALLLFPDFASKHRDTTHGPSSSAAAIGCGIGGNVFGDINVSGARAIAYNDFCGAGIGTAGNDEFASSVQNINIENANLTITSYGGEAIGKGGSPSDPECLNHGYVDSNGMLMFTDVSTLTGTIGNINLPDDVQYSHEWDCNGEIKYHDISRSKSSGGNSGSGTGSGDSNIEYEILSRIGRPLIIHTGTKANQNLHVYINDMRVKALKGKIPNEADKEHLASLSLPKAKEYQDMLDKAKDMTIDDIDVTNRDGANLAIRVIDGALDYALDEATTVGAYVYRLSITEDSLVTTHENSIASESVISDADMAKEMTEYTKASMLSQASQAMLAQANKSSAMTLSLLQ